MNTKDGGPAFPTLLTGKWAGTGKDSTFSPDMTDGMSLRDWFAGTLKLRSEDFVHDTQGAWVVGRCAPDYQTEPLKYLRWQQEYEAKVRYMKADAMLAERERTNEHP